MTRLSFAATAAGIAALAFLSLASLPATAQNPDSAAILEQLRIAENHAQHAEDDVYTLEHYSWTTSNLDLHAIKLGQMKQHVNDLIDSYNQLSAMRSEGSPWQQEAIDRIDPLLRDMADRLNATINHLNENPSKVRMPPYRDYIRANKDLIEKTYKLITDLVDYGEAKTKADALAQDLQIPAPVPVPASLSD